MPRSSKPAPLAPQASRLRVLGASPLPVPHPMSTLFNIRAGQRALERDLETHRVCGFLTRRQYGKTTEAARVALKKMMRTPGHTVVFGSVKLDLGREIVRKESEAIHKVLSHLGTQAAEAKTLLTVCDVQTGKTLENGSPSPERAGRGEGGRLTLRPDDFAELYESSRLEFRLYHSNTIYSRTKVVALTPDAVGETGDLILDEVGRVKQFRDVWEAVRPIIMSNADFRLLLTTTPPPDDTHYSFELLAPPIDAAFPVNPAGNTYRSELGIFVRRITAEDAAADGVLMYDDDTGQPISPAESRAKDHDKDAWDRNYGVKFVLGGTAAIGLLVLETSQRRGHGQCEHFNLDGDLDLDRACAWLAKKLGNGAVGMGWDLATTEKSTSNPSAVTVLERQGTEYLARAIVTWKTNDPALAADRIKQLVDAVRNRKSGSPARRLVMAMSRAPAKRLPAS